LNKKGFGKIILILGIASLLLGFGVIIFSSFFGTSEYYGSFPNFIVNSVPIWFASVIAVTFGTLGFVLIYLGARELGK
jgi:ABC-type multidrug transport system permease subunit